MAVTPTRLYQGQLAATEATLYTVPSGKTVILKQIIVCNPTAVSATFSLSLVPTGGTAGNGNRIIGGPSVSPNYTILYDLASVMNATDFLSAIASAATTLTVTISGIVTP